MRRLRRSCQAVSQGRDQVLSSDVEAVLADFIPPTYPNEVELQNLVAVQECTSRALLPEAFLKLDRDFITRRIKELKLMLGEI